VVDIRKTSIFDRWLRRLRDRKAVARIQSRIDRLQLGLLGDVKPVGEGISEMRIDYGPGYRVYFVQLDQELAILLAGGDKSTQRKDIAKAMELARKL
jgi:putative addiction module killer protein